MKSRSHRSSTNNEWVVEEEESWTVDCICGVNFDDGEEMVNCDECGVWVHTRCSRYVKSEKLFACDKCKNKNNRNDTEETEVAQLLVDLPTKTLRMDNPCSYSAAALPPPPRRPLRLWAETPTEEMVHLQGVPGGDPAMFSGLSSIFGPQLWKSTGFVPKKFNFRYREFPSCDEEELEKKNSEDTNKADNGVGALLSLSKENILSVPAKDAVGVKSHYEDGKVDRLETLEQTCNLEDEKLQDSRPCDVVKDQSLLQSSVLQSGKRKKEDPGMLKDKTGKKKARIMEKDGDFKKKPCHTPGPDRGPEDVKADPQSSKNANLSNILPVGQASQDAGMVDLVIDDHKCHFASSKTCLEKSSCDASRDDSAGAMISKEDNGEHAVPAKLDDSPKTIGTMTSPLDKADSGSVPFKGEVFCNAVVSSHGLGGGSSMSVKANPSEMFVEDAVAVVDNHNTSPFAINMASSNLELTVKAKTEVGDNHVLDVPPPSRYDSKLDTAGISVQYQENSADCSSANDKGDRAAIVSSVASNKKEDVARSFRLVNVGKDRTEDESADEHHESMRDSGVSEEISGRKNDLTGFCSKSVNEQSKCTGILPSQSGYMGECKVALSAGKFSLASSADDLVTKSPPANHMNIPDESQNMDIKQKGTSESNITSEVIKDGLNHERPKKLVKEPAKSSLNSASKSSQSKKVLHSSVPKRTSSDSKENMLHSTPKSPPLPIASAAPRSEHSTMLHTEGASNTQKNASISENESASNVQKKVAVLPQKDEKINQSVSQSSSKVNTSLAHAAISSSSPATLSDEELALLLHHELNSSPRVPRVPRMRHAGSLPQLTSPTAAATMIMKKTSSSGGKEPILTFRRKAKDAAKDGSQGAREVDYEAKKMERVPSSDHGRQDSAPTPDLVSKREAEGSTKVVQSVKKSNALISGTTATSGLSSPTEANEHNLSSTHKSRRNPPGDGKGVVGRRIHLTLPGLIAEIMSKGERMTYEELCNAVLPHWPNLRKHNGERYAYSSHSQAVLDCLRNRNEWARLVDRGPKTSGGRKRRKLDADASGIDSDDDDDDRDRTSKDVRSKSIKSHHEEFPKGKRKARKRRRLALQGRGIRDVRRQRRIEEFSDDEVTSFSSSSEETTPSEDERPVVRRSRARNEIPVASDGT